MWERERNLGTHMGKMLGLGGKERLADVEESSRGKRGKEVVERFRE